MTNSNTRPTPNDPAYDVYAWIEAGQSLEDLRALWHEYLDSGAFFPSSIRRPLGRAIQAAKEKRVAFNPWLADTPIVRFAAAQLAADPTADIVAAVRAEYPTLGLRHAAQTVAYARELLDHRPALRRDLRTAQQ